MPLTARNKASAIKSYSEIDRKAPKYYEEIIKHCKKEYQMDGEEKVAFILVDHCLQTFQTHAESLGKIGRLAGVILKSSTRVEEAERYAYENCNVLNATKESLKDPQVAINLILDNTRPDEKVVIMDHGGYFSYALKEMMAHEDISKRLIGIAEVTENGHHKLAKALHKTPVPNLSVARSLVKELEDAQTGVAICDATNKILYSMHSALNSIQNVCIIGYGKIGRSIANSCRSRGIPNVSVVEIDPIRSQQARLDSHRVINGRDAAKKAATFQKAQIIFSATGANVLSAQDIKNLRQYDSAFDRDEQPAMFIASCTSPDDEFDESFFSELEALSMNSQEDRMAFEARDFFTPYELYDGRNIYVLNGGKAVNFAIGGTPGFEICQVWASVLCTATKLAAQAVPAMDDVQTLSHREEQAIAAITESVYFADPVVEKPRHTASLDHGRTRSLSPRFYKAVGRDSQVSNVSESKEENVLLRPATF